jgi:hypothetical protein
MDIELVWTHPLEQGIYATPVLQQLLSGSAGGGGSKQIILPTFHQHLLLLDGDGHTLPEFSFSAADGSYFHTSPVLFDFDSDGILDMIWASVNAEIFVIRYLKRWL